MTNATAGTEPATSAKPPGTGFFGKFAVLKGAGRELWLLFAVKVLNIAAYGVTNYTVKLWLSSDFGLSDQQALGLVAVWSLLMTGFTILAGSLTDAIGLRRAFFLGVWVSLAARLVMVFSSVKWLAIAGGMFPLALGSALGTPVLVAAVRRFSNTRQRSISFSIFYMMMNVGFLVAAYVFDYIRSPVAGMGEHGHLKLFGLDFSSYRVLLLVAMAIDASVLPLIWFIREGAEATDAGMVFTPRRSDRKQQKPWSAAWSASRETLQAVLRLLRGAKSEGPATESSAQTMPLGSVLFSFHGRIGRATFWTICAVVAAFSYCLYAFLNGIGALHGHGGERQAGLILLVAWLLLAVWVSAAAQAKRWHDMGKSGWWVLIGLVPVIGSLVALASTGFVKGTEGSNRYGARTLQSSSLFLQQEFYGLLAFLGLVAFLKLIFMQMYYVFPTFGIRELGPGAPVGKLWAINAYFVICLVPVIGALTQRFSAYRMVIVGGLISAASVFIMALPANLFAPLVTSVGGQWLGHWYLGLTGSIHPYYVMIAVYVVVLSVGEAFYSPRVYEYAAAIAPKGQEASYGALSYVPFLLAKLLIGTFSAFLLARYCPETGPRHSGMMWLMVALTATIAPVGLLALRRFIRIREAGREE